MKLSTGKVAFPIEFDNGDKDCIYFNPNDPELGTRILSARENITNRIDAINFNDVVLENDGETPKISSVNDFMKLTKEEEDKIIKKAEITSSTISEAKNIICDELNKAFDSDISSVVFKHCSPFAIVNGEYFIIQFLSAITPEIQKMVNKSNAEAEKKMAKHINKYIK